MDVEAGRGDSIANAQLIAPGQGDGHARLHGERSKETEGRAVGEDEVRDERIDGLLERPPARLLARMGAHDLPASAHEGHLEKGRPLAVVEHRQDDGTTRPGGDSRLASCKTHGRGPPGCTLRSMVRASSEDTFSTRSPRVAERRGCTRCVLRAISAHHAYLRAARHVQMLFSMTATLDMSRCFLPEALAGLTPVRMLASDDRRRLNQIRACSYLHLFDIFESHVVSAARARGIEPLASMESLDHHELFRSFEQLFSESFPVRPRLFQWLGDLDEALAKASPQALLVLALHLKLVTQQHYLACVRGDESLEPHFVKVLKDHWTMECGRERISGSAKAIQDELARATPEQIGTGLRDYRVLVFACDDVLRRQAELDVKTLEDAGGVLTDRASVLTAQVAAHRKTFLTVGIVNAAFVYAMRALGPTASSMLAGVVSALGARCVSATE